jgi:hypothetical protein
MRKENVLATMIFFALMAAPAQGDAVLTPGDTIIAIDSDGITSNSRYPSYEKPANILDGSRSTKYLNFGGGGSGFIVTPPSPAPVKSFTITTANDHESRDPTTWELYGTNDEITSVDNSIGLDENWILLGSGTLDLPAERFTTGPVVTLDDTPVLFETPVVVKIPKTDVPDDIPSGAKISCKSSGEGGSSSTCDVIKWNGYSYWIFSYTNNSSQMLVCAYDESDSLVASWNRSGARYLWQITVDEEMQTITLWGQSDRTIVMSWYELLVNPSESGFPIYSSFRMIFPNTKGSTTMQIADVAFYPMPDGIGLNVLSRESDILAIHENWDSRSPSTEIVSNCIDGDPNTKYLNLGGINSGFIVTPSFGLSILDSFEITTANDRLERDPVVWMIYGTNDEIVTVENGDGIEENWTLICGGTMALPDERYALGQKYIIANQAESYTSYKMLFESVKDETATSSMQISEIQFYGVQAKLPGEFQ